MTRHLTLAHLTLSRPPLEMIDAAAYAGFFSVGIRICPRRPDDNYFVDLVEDTGTIPQIRRRARDAGVRLSNVSAFQFYPEVDWRILSRAIDATAALGSEIVVVNCFDPDRSRFLDRLGQYCDAALQHGIRIALELMPYSQVRTIADGQSVLEALGRENAGLLVDALHLDRSGRSIADLESLDPASIAFAHVCDAEARQPGMTDAQLMQEARTARLPLGSGSLRLLDFLHALPRTVQIEYEVAGLPGNTPAEMARMARGDLDAFLGQEK